MRRITRSASVSVSGVEAVDPSELQPDATSVGIVADVPREELLDALTCPISGKLFVDPVTAVCGHTFSRRMLAKWMGQPGRQSSCPTCRAPLYHESPHQWPINTTIADLCERFLNDALREARDSEPALDFPPFDSQYRERLRAETRGEPFPHAGPRSVRDAAHAVTRGDDARGNAHAHSDAVELPLFVLDPMVPGQEITLNVFEERYKRMVRRCMQHTRRFGMVAPADEHHEGALRALTTRERRKGETKRHTRNRPNGTSEGRARGAEEDDAARAYASSEEEEDALESAGDERETSARCDVGRRVEPSAGPFAFLDHGVECVVTAFQEGINGRVLVRCRATRHVKILSAFEDEAGYAVARVVQVADDATSSVFRDEEILAAPETRAARGFARRSPVDRGAAADASADPSDPFAWQTPLMAAVRDAARRKRTGGEARERDACRLRLRLERAVGAHRVWLAHVSGRQLEGCPSAGEGASGRGSGRAASRLPWARGGLSGDYFRQSYGGKPENLLALSGARPRADRPEALAWWLARVANPLPPLGAALELRSTALSASSVTRRFSRIHRGLVGSMRSVHGLAFEDFRGARPAAAAAVAIAWCRAVEASARLDARLETEGASDAEGLVRRARLRGSAVSRSKRDRDVDALDEANASARAVVDADAYRDAPRARNRHRFQFLVDAAARVLVESVSRFGEMRDARDETREHDGDGGTGTGTRDDAWPAMRATPLPGFDPRRRGAPAYGGGVVGGSGAGEAPRDSPQRLRHRNDSAGSLEMEMRERMAFWAAKGGAPCVAWALYRHLSRFEDATFEALAEGIGWAIDPSNPDFAFVPLDEADRARYASHDVIEQIPFVPADFAGSVPDDFPRPGDAARARAAIGVAPAARRAAAAFGFTGARRGWARRSSYAVAVGLLAARGATHKLMAFALTAFMWTVVGVGHLLALALLALWVPSARALGRAFPRRRGAALGRPGTGPVPVRARAADRFGVGVGEPAPIGERDGGWSRLASGAFALASAAALFLVLDSAEAEPGARG